MTGRLLQRTIIHNSTAFETAAINSQKNVDIGIL